MYTTRIQPVFFVFLLVIAGWLIFSVFRPFLTPLFLAVAFAVVFEPLHRKILLRVRRPSLSALLTVLAIIILVLIPLFFLGGLLFNEARDLYLQGLSGDVGVGILQVLANNIQGYAERIAPDVSIDINVYIEQGLRWIVSHLGSVFTGFVRILFGLLLMILALFYLLRDGEKFKARLVALSPLSNDYDEKILTKLKRAINSVVKGSLIVALVQGIAAGIGFMIFGIPNPILWGTITVFAALIPGIGTAIILVPAAGYLFYINSIGAGIGLLVWGAVIVGLVDNFLVPFLLERGIKLHPFLILLSVLGGIIYFGPIGFLAGPVLLSFLFALLEIYPLMVTPSPKSVE